MNDKKQLQIYSTTIWDMEYGLWNMEDGKIGSWEDWKLGKLEVEKIGS